MRAFDSTNLHYLYEILDRMHAQTVKNQQKKALQNSIPSTNKMNRFGEKELRSSCLHPAPPPKYLLSRRSSYLSFLDSSLSMISRFIRSSPSLMLPSIELIFSCIAVSSSSTLSSSPKSMQSLRSCLLLAGDSPGLTVRSFSFSLSSSDIPFVLSLCEPIKEILQLLLRLSLVALILSSCLILYLFSRACLSRDLQSLSRLSLRFFQFFSSFKISSSLQKFLVSAMNEGSSSSSEFTNCIDRGDYSIPVNSLSCSGFTCSFLPSTVTPSLVFYYRTTIFSSAFTGFFFNSFRLHFKSL